MSQGIKTKTNFELSFLKTQIMFQFMKKEKTEEEKAEKVKKKSDKRDRKEKKARNASALSSDDLARLAEVRRSLKMSKAETAVLSGITAGSVGVCRRAWWD